MSSLFNPYALTALGKPLQQRQSPELRVETPHISRAQLDMAQHTFVRFLDQARLSRVPNPTQQGRLADGTPYRIVTASGAPIMQVWPVQPQVGKSKGEIYGGYLYITNEKQYVVDVITEDGKHTGKWGVRYIDKGIRLVPLIASNKQNIVIDGPKGSKIPYLYATNRELGYLFSGGIPYLKLPEDNRFYYLQDSVSKVVNGTDWDNGRIYSLMLSSGSDNDISYEYAEITKDLNIKSITWDALPEVIPQLNVIGRYPGKTSKVTFNPPRHFSRDGKQVIRSGVREVKSYLSVADVPSDPNKKILRRSNVGIVYPAGDGYQDVTNIVSNYYNGDDYKTSENIYTLYNVTEYGIDDVREIKNSTTLFHPEITERVIGRPLGPATKWSQLPIGGAGTSGNKVSIPVSYVEEDEVNETKSWATGGGRGYAVGEEFKRDFNASYRMVSEGTTLSEFSDFFDFSGRLIEGSVSIEEEYSFSGSLSRSATYHYDDWFWGGSTRVLVEPGMNPGIYKCLQVMGSGHDSTTENSIVTEETYSRSARRIVNGLDLEIHKNNTVVKTSSKMSYQHNKSGSSYKITHTIDVNYSVRDLEILLADQYLDLIIYREQNRSHSYTSEYYKGARPELSGMVESEPVIVVIHNKKEVRRYVDNLKMVDPPYSYMSFSSLLGFEWVEAGGVRGSPEFRMMHGQHDGVFGFGYISTNIFDISSPTAYHGTDNETVTYIKSPSTGTSLINIKAGESVFTIFVDKISVHDYHDVMESLELGAPKSTGQVI